MFIKHTGKLQTILCCTLFFLCFSAHTVSAQHRYDTTGILALIKAGTHIEQPNPDSAIRLYKSALKKSEDVYFIDGIMYSLQYLYDVYVSKGRYDTLMNVFQEAAITCGKPKQLSPTLPMIYTGIGNLYKSESKYELAMDHYLKAMSLIEHLPAKDTSGGISSSRVYNSLACNLYNNMGSVLMTFERDSEALHYLSKAELEAQKTDNHDVLCVAWTNMGIINMYKKDWERSQYYFHAAIALARKYNIVPDERFALVSMSSMYQEREMPKEAISYSQQALSLKGNINPFYQNLAFRNIGAAYSQLHDYKQAKKYLLDALEIAKKYNLVKGVADTHELLANIYSKEGLYKEAFEHIQACFSLERTIQSEDVTQNLNQLEVKYRTSQKDKEILANRLQISQQENYLKKKNIWIGSISAISLLLIILFVSLYRINLHKQHVQAKELALLQQEQKVLYKEQEIVQLKAMMDGEEKERSRIARELHDGIGGMLSTVKLNLGVIKEEYHEPAQVKKLNGIIHMLQDIATEVRKTAHNLMPDMLIRYNLKRALELYCDNINMSNQLEIILQFHGDMTVLDKSTELILYRISQELLQNIIKHANATYAAIQITQHEGKLNIIVEDNGTGFDTNDSAEGYGLQNLRFRVQALKGNLSIMSAKDRSTTINIEFDLPALKNNA